VGAGPLPLPDAWADAVFVLFAAHEVRDDAERAALFCELRRVLAPGAAIHVVEHLRDPANVLAYGPGAWHFLARATWLRTFAAAALHVTSERRMTPFLRWFVLGSREA
ncbi:MAG: class I SAM-dependent methyltransferase, partial [Planctomycetes bacterium]|nr:class I SAM-dependent methyltransferase [Planctomycetota bacterium]